MNSRACSATWGKTLGQPVIVEDLAGAGGTIGSNRVARAAPDGYTFQLGHRGSQIATALL